MNSLPETSKNIAFAHDNHESDLAHQRNFRPRKLNTIKIEIKIDIVLPYSMKEMFYKCLTYD